MSELRDLYEEVILDHNRNPRNYPHRPSDCTHSADGYNPLCGDAVKVHLTVSGGLITDVGFEGDGCAISTASASMMTEALKGKSPDEATALFEKLHTLLTDDDADPNPDIGKLMVLSGVKEFPMRVKCATLAWHTMVAALKAEQAPVTTE